MEGNLRLCAEGCFSRFSTTAKSLRNYVDLSFSSLMEKFVLSLAEETMHKGPFGVGMSYAQLLCVDYNVAEQQYEIHAKNYLLNTLLSELTIKSLVIQDRHSNYFIVTHPEPNTLGVKNIYLHFSKRFKKSFGLVI